MKIVITQNLISKAKPNDPDSCPIALAIKQQHKVAVSVGVYDVYNLDTMTAHPLPTKALKFRNRFDNGLDVAPCSLEVDF